MGIGRRDFLKCSAVAGLGPVALLASSCADTSPNATPKVQDDLLKIGLYQWAEFVYLAPQLQWLDLAYVRVGGVMSEALMTFCVNQNLEVLLNVTPAAARTTFNSDAEFVAAYIGQVKTALSTFGPDGTFWKANPTLPHKPITAIEVCNEPNFGYGFSGTPEEIATLYARLLIDTYNFIKPTWPDVTVVGFSTGGASNAAPGFVSAALTALKAAGQVDCFDVMSLHPYSSNRPPEQVITESWGTWVDTESIHAVQQLMHDFGISTPLWITEVGYQISGADGGKYSAADLQAAGNLETVTLAQQAAYTIRMNMAAARLDIPRVYHMSALDTDDFNSGWFGVGPAHDARPVAVAMRQLIRLLHGSTLFEVVLDGGTASPESPFAYRFSGPQASLLVAWCQVPGTFKLPIDPDRKTSVTDMLGNSIATLTDSSYEAALSENPIFLHST